MAEAKRDQNQIVTLMGVTDDGNLTPVNLVVDPTTGRLKVSAVISTGSVTSINGLVAATQLFAVGTTGDDFNIASAVATHTFNLPTASATKRGALSSADWTTFNNKANALGADDNYVTDAEKTKLGYISITQAVDLDALETRVNALDAAVVLAGSWDASAGTFPGGGTAQAGYTYIVSVAGTVDSVVFNVGDRILAILDNASTSTYAANWIKLDYTDQVLSVAGKTGAVTLQVADITDMTANARSFNQAADYSAMRTALGVAIGTNVQAYDATLTDLAAGNINETFTFQENTSLELDAALSGDGKYCGITETGTAGAALAFGDLVYLAAADSRWELTDANAAATAGDVKIGICVLAAAGDGSATKILLWGKVRADAVFPALTISAPVYIGEVAGDIVVTQPTTADVIIRKIGFGNTADELFFCPSTDYITHT